MKAGKMVTAGVLAAMCSACVPVDEGRIVAAKGYDIPKSGETIPIMGRTFYGSIGTGSMPLIKEQPGLAGSGRRANGCRSDRTAPGSQATDGRTSPAPAAL